MFAENHSPSTYLAKFLILDATHSLLTNVNIYLDLGLFREKNEGKNDFPAQFQDKQVTDVSLSSINSEITLIPSIHFSSKVLSTQISNREIHFS